MSAPNPARRRAADIVRTLLIGAAFTAVVVLLLLWLAGTSRRKIDNQPHQDAAPPAGRPAGDVDTVAVRSITRPRVEFAVGTVEAVHKSAVASKLLAKVTAVNVVAGQSVKQGDVLVTLDDTDLRARVEQADAVLQSALAHQTQAQTEYDRVKGLFDIDSAARIELDRVTTGLRAAEAEVVRSRQALQESETVLDYSVIRSPIDGIIVDKRVQPGDTATPSQVLLTLYDPSKMQLVASVRESLTHRLHVGQKIGVRVDALTKTCQGTVSEIVPQADATSRTFSVKVTGPCPPGIYSGMFGRLLVPLEDEALLVIPASAVQQVGQLNLVEVVQDDRLQRRAVQLGRTLDGGLVQVLSGLREHERIAAVAGISAEPDAPEAAR